MIFVNFKTYESGTGEKALLMGKIISDVSKESNVRIIPVVQPSDVYEMTRAVDLEVWVQKVDPVEFGASTGSIIPEAVLEDGASGTFLNHSESPLSSFDELAKVSDRANEAGLRRLIFAKDIETLKKVCSLSPDFVAYEPPELVGSETTSVAQASADVISMAADIARNAGLPLIVGAGIHSWEDVKKSLQLGAVGVAVASDIMKAEDPKKELLDLTKGFE